MTKKIKKIFIAGHRGMVGSSIYKNLKMKANDHKILVKDKSQLDLSNQKKVSDFIKKSSIDEIYIAAAKVGGIHANNTYPADFLYKNLQIELNLINSSWESEVQKILFLGSSCIYPRDSKQPIKEEYLLSGYLEHTNESYAISKIAGIKLCESYNRQFNTDYRSLMPSNLYGPGDNYHETNSHVIPALIRRFHEAKENDQKELLVWGSGKPKREFLYVDDLADACHFIMNISKKEYKSITTEMCSHLNVGFGTDISIKDLAYIISETVGYKGKIKFDPKKHDGTMRKLMDSSKIQSLGWKPKISLDEGICLAYKDFKRNQKTLRC